MNILRSLCLLAMLSLTLFGCGGKPASVGDSAQLVVVADNEVWADLEDQIRGAFERTVHTPQPEKVFEIIHVGGEEWKSYATRKNLAFVGSLQGTGEISLRVQKMLSEGVRRKVEDGTAYVFPRHDPWAQEQLLLVLASNSTAELGRKLSENSGYLYGLFADKLREETKEQMYAQLEQTDLAAQTLEKYGWALRVQHDYVVYTERPDRGFYLLRRSLPGRERWLFVHWREDIEPDEITDQWIMDARDRLGAEFLNSDQINRDPQYLNFRDVIFAERSAVVLEGLWENDEVLAGGPFRTYVFYDEDTRRTYMVDIAVYYPAGSKEPFLRQLDIMANTFQTAQDLKRKKQKETS